MLDIFGSLRMKNMNLRVCLVVLWTIATNANAIVFHDHDLGIFGSVPPAEIVVVDSAGNKAGVDETMPLDQYGQGKSISTILGSEVQQQNISTDETVPQPQPNTSWIVFIVDQPAQSYSVNLLGISSGIEALSFASSYTSKLGSPIQVQSFLMEKGLTRTVSVNYDPIAEALTITPVINSGDFLRDTQSACGLDDIGPVAACEAFEALASEVEKAIIKGDTKVEAEDLEVYLFLLERLNLWGQKGQPGNWDAFKDHPECNDLCNDRLDDKFFITASAYSALKLDAETLLAPIKNQGDHDWR
jgi:hypothetical protein